jgi:hypothetical protein
MTLNNLAFGVVSARITENTKDQVVERLAIVANAVDEISIERVLAYLFHDFRSQRFLDNRWLNALVVIHVGNHLTLMLCTLTFLNGEASVWRTSKRMAEDTPGIGTSVADESEQT